MCSLSRVLACAWWNVAFLLGVLLSTRGALAAKYEVFIDIETEEDLYELYIDEQIGEETLEALIDLYQRGLDLDAASRERLYVLPNLTYADVDAILDYRQQTVRLRDVWELVDKGVLSFEKARSIAAFVKTRGPTSTSAAWVRLSARTSNGDKGWPATALSARGSVGQVSAGIAAVGTRRRLGKVDYDPVRDALRAEAPRPQLVLPKYYAKWSTLDYDVIVGTYRIGFGQRLTFDTTNQYTPHGIYPDHELLRTNALGRACRESAGELDVSPCAGVAGAAYEMPDFRWRSRLRGVASGIKDLSLGGGSLVAYGFVSHQAHDLYQYHVYDRRDCDDPREDEPGCGAPHVFRKQEDPFLPTSRWSFHTLPNLYTELLGGAHMAYRYSRRVHIGLTGYRSSVSFQVPEMELDFQDFARLPYGGPFGAVGLDAGWGQEWLDLFVEATRSFDSMPGRGGGFAALSRSTATWGKNEAELSLRYYEAGFANPHARPISAPSQYEGLRARDEMGVRLRYTGRPVHMAQLRSTLDVWRPVSAQRFSVLGSLRGDFDLSRPWQVGIWAESIDRNLGENGRNQCFQSPFETDEEGEPVPCAGSRHRVGGRVRWAPSRRYFLTGQLRHDFVDDGRYTDRFRRDVAAWLTAGAEPHRDLRLRARVRYLFEDISDNGYLEQSLWSYGEVSYRLLGRSWLRVRYDRKQRLDDRDSTRLRSPAPEQWLALDVESRF